MDTSSIMRELRADCYADPTRSAAADLIERLQGALDSTIGLLDGMIGFVDLLIARQDLPAGVREALISNHRVIAARRARHFVSDGAWSENLLHSEYADLISEALSDAICNGSGRPRAKDLLVEFDHRGLLVVEASALQKIAAGNVEVFDEDTGGNVLVSMSADEAADIARAAIARATGAA